MMLRTRRSSPNWPSWGSSMQTRLFECKLTDLGGQTRGAKSHGDRVESTGCEFLSQKQLVQPLFLCNLVLAPVFCRACSGSLLLRCCRTCLALLGTCSAAAGASARCSLENYNSQVVHLILQTVVLQPGKSPLKRRLNDTQPARRRPER